ncbi:hypothetical protein [Paraliomyxa miuraensis]|uniref:hypothetical protein n=1 Tax=Paraliomyxa miuraensis TaxID=376150 RepID=UPI00225463F3|nr:hypothetical protein [Paraliomyxa miuraensis]MCX4247973.1 hypothetical protein [Paraliomyxa miuraensis]
MSSRSSSMHSRVFILGAAFLLGLGITIPLVDSTPWRSVLRTFDVVLVDEDCGFSQIAAHCLRSAPRAMVGRTGAVAVPTAIRGPASLRACRETRAAVAASGDLVARLSSWTHSEAAWCQRLAQGAREWLVSRAGGEQWPTFVHRGELVGVGLMAEHFEAVGESSAAARLPECIDDHLLGRRDHSDR